MTDKEWQAKFLSLYPEGLRMAKELEKERPLQKSESVVWLVDGRTGNDRAFEFIHLDGGNAVIQGYRDGHPEEPEITEVPLAHIARASDVLKIIVEDLGHKNGLCQCHPQPVPKEMSLN
jgi:hypothetical protein